MLTSLFLVRIETKSASFTLLIEGSLLFRYNENIKQEGDSMRKRLLWMLTIFLCGCTFQQAKPPVEEKPELSTMFVRKGVDKMFDDSAAIENRLNNLRVNEIESIRFILNDEFNETAMEYQMIDQEMIHQFKEIINHIQVNEENETLPEGRLFAFEVMVKDKDSIVFKGNNNGFCLTQGKCVLLDEKSQLFEFFNEHATEGIHVYPVDLKEITVNFESWGDQTVESLEVEEPMFETEILGDLVYNTWYSTNDPWYQALKMAFYFNEEFEDYHTIQNWDKIVAGLAIQMFEQGYRRNNYGGDPNTYYGPHGDVVQIEIADYLKPVHFLQPDCFVTYSMMEKVGKVLFGSDFMMPEIDAEYLASYPMFKVNHSLSQKLCIIHSPYEYFYATLESGLLLEEKREGNKRIYDLLIFTKTMEFPDDGKTSHFMSEVYYVYRNDFDEPFETIEGNEDYFKQVRIELEEYEEGIRINSFKYLNRLEPIEDVNVATGSDC